MPLLFYYCSDWTNYLKMSAFEKFVFDLIIQINLIILCWSSWKESPKLLLLPPIGIPIFISSSWPLLAVLFGDWDEGIESSLMANSLRPPANTEFPPFAAIPLLFAPFKSVGPVTYKRTIKCGSVRDINIECSKQFKKTTYTFNVSGQSGLLWAVLKLL